MKEMPYLVREEPCTCNLSENHAPGLSTHAVHSDGHVRCRYDGGFPWWTLNRRSHLTDAECAAEMWRARADMCSATPVFTSGAELQRFIRVWERMATTPHARESAYE